MPLQLEDGCVLLFHAVNVRYNYSIKQNKDFSFAKRKKISIFQLIIKTT